jgi:hypothetical protein
MTMNIINTSFCAGPNCLTFGFRRFGLRVLAPFVPICFFFTWHFHIDRLGQTAILNQVDILYVGIMLDVLFWHT